ncbi:hypothetical protein GCM10011316_26370 [Roseibium aquae]|uniref:DUF3291 domain-containing protein n=1 Tax=Roseibium aquae TaxID=1323746 RepID=A0A916X2G5_9HYPH|nr:DUF3291 domain-containing protein [Roseibium aquae]GGB53057.1 hypothetical protein GCM10011316_26370 [Roseibium aquae]
MSDFHLAAYTFNRFLDRYQSDRVKGFREAEPAAFAAMDAADGLVGRSGYDGEPGPASWGPQVFPKYWEDNGDGFAPSTLSLWRSIEALMAATYHGPHGQAFRQGARWHVRPTPFPAYVLWWTPYGHRPDWRDAVSRLERLGDQGPTPATFTFKTAYSPDGTVYHPDVELIKNLARLNAARVNARRVRPQTFFGPLL